jgi:hypothetical protein
MATSDIKALQPVGTERRLFDAWRAIAGGIAILIAGAAFAYGANTRAGTPMVLAQAGSTGGTIGKQGKSVSGEDEHPARHSRPKDSKVPEASGSVAGHWRWSADCAENGQWHGEFVLTSTSPGKFTGSFGNVFDGTITEGHFNGTNVSFTRHFALGTATQVWTGQLNSGHLQGSLSGTSLTGSGSCSWEASKK